MTSCPQITKWDAEKRMNRFVTFNQDGSVQNTFTLCVDYHCTWPLIDFPLTTSDSPSCTDLNPDGLHIPPNDVSFVCVAVEGNSDCVSA